MTRDEILALKALELDRAIHEWLTESECIERPDGLVERVTMHKVPRYFADANAARLVLAEVERRGLERQFTCRWFETEGMETDRVMRICDAFNATPTQVCHSALLAVQEGLLPTTDQWRDEWLALAKAARKGGAA